MIRLHRKKEAYRQRTGRQNVALVDRGYREEVTEWQSLLGRTDTRRLLHTIVGRDTISAP